MKPSRTFALAGVLWLVCVAAAAGVLARGQTQEREGLFQRFEARSDTGASFVSAYVDDVFDAEQRLADRVVQDSTRSESFARTVDLMGFSAAVLLDPEGRALALAPDNPEMVGAEIASKYRHLSAALAGDRAVSDIVPSAVEGDPIVAFALPLPGGSGGVLSAGFSLEDSPLKAFLERQPIAGTRGYILDSAGTVIVSAGAGAAAGGSRLELPKAFEASVDQGRLVASTPVPGTPWTYMLDAPLDAVLAPLSTSGAGEWAILVGLAAVSFAGFMVTAGALASRARARGQQAEADSRFRLTVEHAPIGMTMVSLDHRFLEPNTRLCRMLGYSVEELESMSFDDITHADDLDLDLEMLTQLVAGETRSYESEKRYIRGDGSILWGRLTVSVVRNEQGHPQYFVSQIEDVTLIRAALEDLERRALYDPLTGLANRGLLLDRLDSALNRRKAGPVAIAFCDLDHFKHINDQHGHHTGDAVLIEVARRLNSSVRVDDTVARMGGDEFVILLTDVESPQAAELVVDRATRAVQQHIVVEGSSFTVGISAGLAFAQPGDSAETLLRNADAALYAAKAAGRARIEVHSPAPGGNPSPEPPARVESAAIGIWPGQF